MGSQNKANRWGAVLRAALPVTAPVMAGYVCLGLAFGVLLADIGYHPGWALLSSVVIFAGSVQFVMLDLLRSLFDPFQAFLLAVLVNARHIFYGLSVLDKYKGAGKARPYLIFALSDETYSLVSTIDPPEGMEPKRFYLAISALDQCYWVTGSVLGAVLGQFLPFDTTGMDFALTALFVVLFMEQCRPKDHRPAGVIGVVCGAVSLAVFGPDNLVIAAMVLILAALLGGRKRLCA